jgi:hypothetical protein
MREPLRQIPLTPGQRLSARAALVQLLLALAQLAKAVMVLLILGIVCWAVVAACNAHPSHTSTPPPTVRVTAAPSPSHTDGPVLGTPCPKDDPEIIFGSDGTKVRCTDGRWVVDTGTGDLTTGVGVPCFGYQNNEVTSTWDGTRLRCVAGLWTA